MKRLAINGATPAITGNLKPYKSIGNEEREAVLQVMDTGVLSSFVAGGGTENLGGVYVQRFEEAWAKTFNVEHVISVNSWTSGLICCLGAIELEPFDEVITSPWTMCATATSILHWNAIPVFADIDPYTFTLCPVSVEASITEKTKAILAVDIFGRECNLPELRKLADKYGIKLVTDSAQAPLVKSKFGNYYVGTKSDVGGFSLNYHKHIHTGEGGIVVTDDHRVAEIARGIRNHGEANHELVKAGYRNLVGQNYRLGELESAIGLSQLQKGHKLVASRQVIALELIKFFEQFDGLTVPLVDDEVGNHGFYVFPLLFDIEKVNVSRSKIIAALAAEGLNGFMDGYINLSEWIFFKNKIGYGSNGFPWSASGKVYQYGKELTPIATELHSEKFLGFEMCLYELGEKDLQLFKTAFTKVWENLDELRQG